MPDVTDPWETTIEHDGVPGRIERVQHDEHCTTPLCTGTAHVQTGVLRCPGHPLDGRSVVPGQRLCDDCKQRRADRERQLEQQNAETERMHGELMPSLMPATKPVKPLHRFEPIPPEYREADWMRVPAKHRALLEDWHVDPDSLYLFGGTGAGKSMLAAALAMRHMEVDPAALVVYQNVSIMLDKIRRTINRPERTEQLIEQACQADLLVLDDLGAETSTRWLLDRLYVIVESRIEYQRPTVITSNYGMSDLRTHLLDVKDRGAEQAVKAVDRLISRLRGKHRVLVPLTGRDQRIHPNPPGGTHA